MMLRLEFDNKISVLKEISADLNDPGYASIISKFDEIGLGF